MDMTSLIPTMTSNTTPSGVASASSVYGTSWLAFNAFIPNNGDWVSSTTTGWLRYQFPTATVVNTYSLLHWTAGVNGMPKNWTFEGSNDGTNWSVLDTRTNQENWQTKEEREYSFANITQYLNYRINCSANNGNAMLSIGFLAMNYQIPPLHKILLSSGDKYYSLTKINGDKLNPNMISNSIPSGLVSSIDNQTNAYLAFDGIQGTSANDGWKKSSFTSGDWLQYKFDKPTVVDSYLLAPINNSNLYVQSPKNWSFQGSNDGTNWIILDAQIGVSYTVSDMGVGRIFSFDNSNPYSMYRISITANNGSTTLSIGELLLLRRKNKLISLDNISEELIQSYGINDSLQLNEIISDERRIKSTKNILESGKTFTHTVDLSKRRVDKIILS